MVLPCVSQSYTASQVNLLCGWIPWLKTHLPKLRTYRPAKTYTKPEKIFVQGIPARCTISGSFGNEQNFIPQLLNESGNKAVWQEKYEIQDGFAYGRVYLDNGLSEGDYLLAAYTANSLLNDNTEFYAVRRIRIRKDMNYRPSLKVTFDKIYYNENDSVRLNFSLPAERGIQYLQKSMQHCRKPIKSLKKKKPQPTARVQPYCFQAKGNKGEFSGCNKH